MKTSISTIVICCTFAFSALVVSAQTYQPLAPLPIISEGGEVTIATFLPGIYKLAVGAASVIAVVIIILAGFKYMTSEGGKSEARQSIKNALTGLLMLLGSYLLLYTINPELLKLKLDFGRGGPGQVDFVAIAKANGNFSGFTPELVTQIEDAQRLYNDLMRQGRVEEANEVYFNAVTDSNFQKAMNLAGGDEREQTLARDSMATMNRLFNERIENLYEEGQFDEAASLEARQIYNDRTFKHQSKELLIAEGLGSGVYDARSARQEVIRMQSEAEQTYVHLNERDPAAAAVYKRETDARIERLSATIGSIQSSR